MRSSVVAASAARRPLSSHTTTGTPREGTRLLHARLELAARHRARAGDVREVVLAVLAHVDQGQRRALVEELGEDGGSDLAGHDQAPRW